MRRDEFLSALDRYGGNLAAWPDDQRAAAGDLVERDADAAAELRRMQTIERAIAEATRPAAADATLIGRTLATATGGRPAAAGGEIALRPTPRLAALAGAATAAWLAIGFVAGLALPLDTGEDAYAGLIFGESSYMDGIDSESVL